MSAQTLPQPTVEGNGGIYAVLDLAVLRESKTNPRTHYDATELGELAESIKTEGVIEPIIVRPLQQVAGKPMLCEIVAGTRRFRASKIAGKQSIPAIVREMNDNQALQIQIIENLQRRDIHPLDEATGYKRLMELAKWTAEKIAAKVGKSEEYIYTRMKLAELSTAGQKAFREGKLSTEHAVLLARLEPKDQAEGLERSLNAYHPYTVRQLRTWAKERDDAAKTRARIRAEIAAAEKNGKKVVKILEYNMGMPPKGVLPESEYTAAGKGKCEHTALGFYVSAREPDEYEGRSLTVCTQPKTCPIHKKKVIEEHREQMHISQTGRSFAEERKRRAEQIGTTQAIAAVVKKAQAFNPSLLRFTLLGFAYRLQNDNARVICKAHEWEPKKITRYGSAYSDYDATVRAQIESMPLVDLVRFGLEMAMREDPAVLTGLCKHYKVNRAAFTKKAIAELAAKEREKKARANAKAKEEVQTSTKKNAAKTKASKKAKPAKGKK